MNQIKVLIVVAAVCVAAWAQDAPPLPPLPTSPPTVPAVPAVPTSPANSDAAAPADSAAAAPAASSDGAGTCWTCGLETPSCTYDSFTVPDGEDASNYQKGASDPTRPCTFCIVQKSEDPDQNIKGLYRGCNDYDPTNGGSSPSYTYDQDGVTYTVTTKACNTALCNQG